MWYSGTVFTLYLCCPPQRLALPLTTSTLPGCLRHFHPMVMEDWIWFLPASINTAFFFFSQSAQSNRRLSLWPEGRMSVFMMLPSTCRPQGRRLEGGRLNDRDSDCCHSFDVLTPSNHLSIMPSLLPCFHFCYLLLSSLPHVRADSPVQIHGPRPLPGAEWKCQRLLKAWLFLPLQLGTLSQQVRKCFFLQAL